MTGPFRPVLTILGRSRRWLQPNSDLRVRPLLWHARQHTQQRRHSPLPPLETPVPIATPESYAEMLDRAKAGRFAYPAINVTSSQTLNAALRGGRR